MAKTKISEFSTTAGNNTDINSINIAEGCAPSGINDAIRELMRQLKEFQTGGAGDSVNSGGDFSVATNKFTVASASGNTAVAGTLAVTGATTLTGALVANGNATLGDGSGDTVTVKGTPTLEVNPTLSGGTANGVLYLNGSKVATSGSALTFDGTNFSATGTTTVNSANSTAVALVVKGETGNGIRQRFIGQASSGQYNWQIGASITAAGEFSFMPSTAVDGTTFTSSVYNITPTGVSYWSVGGSEAMRLTSTGLGIGTSSPAYKLDVSGSAPFRVNTTANNQMILSVSGTAYSQIAANSSSALVVMDGGATGTLLNLTQAGNLGLGVTPSAWNAGKAIEVGTVGNSIWGVGAGEVVFGQGAYYNSGYKYANSSYAASTYEQYRGTHVWKIAPSGTAGNAISFTQAMTLDASGNLVGGGKTSAGLTNTGFELTSDGSFRSTKSSTSTNLATNNGGSLQLTNSSATDGNFSNIGGYNSNGLVVSQIDFINVSHASRTGDIAFLTHNGSALTERARIASNGNFGIGTTNPGAVLDVTNGASPASRFRVGVGAGAANTLYSTLAAGDYINFETNGAERARIDSSGNFLFNQSSAGYQNSNSICNDQAGFITINHIGGTSSGTSFVNFGYGASGIGSITQSGTTAVAYNTTSDQRLKENIVDAPEFGSVIDSIKVRSYDWKADGNHQRAGFVAQELVTVAPEAVHQPADPEEMMAVDYSKLVPMLVKEIQSLRARVAQLESN